MQAFATSTARIDALPSSVVVGTSVLLVTNGLSVSLVSHFPCKFQHMLVNYQLVANVIGLLEEVVIST